MKASKSDTMTGYVRLEIGGRTYTLNAQEARTLAGELIRAAGPEMGRCRWCGNTLPTTELVPSAGGVACLLCAQVPDEVRRVERAIEQASEQAAASYAEQIADAAEGRR